MATSGCSSTQASGGVVIYDRRDCAAVGGLGVQERVAACYRWASARGHQVIEQCVSFGDALGPLPAVLSHALEVCATRGASLLVYTERCLGEDEVLRAMVTARLSGRALLVVLPDAACAVAP